MGTRLSDSRQYAHLWGTPSCAQLFEERARLQAGSTSSAALARAQAAGASSRPRPPRRSPRTRRAERLDLDQIARADAARPGTRRWA